MTDGPRNEVKMMSDNSLKLRFSESSWNLVRGSQFQLLLFKNFGFQGYSSNSKLAVIIKRWIDRQQ